LANFEGVAEIICDYQKSTQPWDGNEPVDLVLDVFCRVAAGRGSKRR
jgi:hypothetical protein